MKLSSESILLSPEDEDLRQYGFYLTVNGYAQMASRKVWRQFNERECHKIVANRIGLIANKENDLCIDHINQNKLDNRRENLRLVNRQINACNSKKNLKSKGVYFDKARQNYRAEIYINKKKVSLGRFATYEEARKAYVDAKNKRLTELGLTDLLLEK